MRLYHAFSLLALLGAGCAGTPTSPALTNDHPASADAPSSPMPAMSNVLLQAEPVMPAAGSGGQDAGQHQHGGMSSMGGIQDAGSPPQANAASGAATQTAQPAAAAAYACPMHPDVTSDQPSKCPKCGMKLVKQEQSQAGGDAHGNH